MRSSITHFIFKCPTPQKIIILQVGLLGDLGGPQINKKKQIIY